MDNLMLLILLIVVMETVAISCVKEFHINGNYLYFVLAIFFYSIVCYCLNRSFEYTTMGITNIIWSGLSILLVTIAGVLFFREELHYHDIVAGALITSGMLILRYTK